MAILTIWPHTAQQWRPSTRPAIPTNIAISISKVWQPQKLYYTAFARTDLLLMRDALRERGIPWGDENAGEELASFTVPDERITTRVAIDQSHLLRMREDRTSSSYSNCGR